MKTLTKTIIGDYKVSIDGRYAGSIGYGVTTQKWLVTCGALWNAPFATLEAAVAAIK